jgi:hypothetical protein
MRSKKIFLLLLGAMFFFLLNGVSVAEDEALLVGHWNFESSVNVVDLTGTFPNGTSYNVTWNSGQQAAYFNGTNAYMKIEPPSPVVDLTDSCMIEARVYCMTDPWSKIIFGGYFDDIGYNLTGQYFGYTNSLWTTLNYTLPCDQWVTVKAVRHAGKLQVYLNDVLSAEMNDPNTPPQNPVISNKFHIGVFPNFDWYFKRYIKDIKLYTFTAEKDRDEWIDTLEPVYTPTKQVSMGPVNNNPGILVDSVPVPGVTGYFGYLFTDYGFVLKPNVSFHEAHLNQLALAGVNIHQIDVNINVPTSTVLMSAADSQIADILSRQSDAIFLLRVSFITNAEFSQQYPDDVVIFNDGTTGPWSVPKPSFASHKWERKAAEGLVNLAEALSTKGYKDKVIGMVLTGGEAGQWLWWTVGYDYEQKCIDFSPVMLQRFVEYLQGKYVTESALRAAWNDSGVTFATVAIPTKAERGVDVPNSVSDYPPNVFDGGLGYFRNPDNSNNQKVVDYYASMSLELGRRMTYLCQTFKKATDNRLVAGAFYGPMSILGY